MKILVGYDGSISGKEALDLVLISRLSKPIFPDNFDKKEIFSD